MPNLYSLFPESLVNACCAFHNTLCEISSSSLPSVTSGTGLSCYCELACDVNGLSLLFSFVYSIISITEYRIQNTIVLSFSFHK